MAKALLRFRCYQCDKLLGASASKAGKTTTCPNCQAELIIPDLADSTDRELEAATRALIPNLDEPARIVEPAPRQPAHEAGFSWEDIDTALFKSGEGASPIDFSISTAPPEPVVEPKSEPGPPLEVTVAPPEPVVLTPAGPAVLPEIDVEESSVRPAATARQRPRAGEVVLAQSVLASWSLFVLLALAISFIAGLFVGHYVWKGR